MTPDLALVLGICATALSLPSLLEAWSEERAPRIGLVLLLAGLSGVIYALQAAPGGYTPADVPAAFARVLATILN